MPLKTPALAQDMAGFKVALLQHQQIRVSQLLFLWAVALKPGSTHSEIAAETGLSIGGVSRNVDIFGSRKPKSAREKSLGLVDVRNNPRDDRTMLIDLTDKGRNFIELYQQCAHGNLV